MAVGSVWDKGGFSYMGTKKERRERERKKEGRKGKEGKEKHYCPRARR